MKRFVLTILFFGLAVNAWAIDECRQHSFDGYAQPCPVLNVDDRTMIDQTFEVELTPSSESHYILSTIYILNNNEWQPYRFDVADNWINTQTLNVLNPQELNLNAGFYYMVSWDWLWDAEAGCYKGAGLNECDTGQWRITVFQVQEPISAQPEFTYVVSQDGTGDFIRIQDAVDVAQSGDTIFVRGGTYHERVVMKNSGVTLVGERGNNNEWLTIIDGSDLIASGWDPAGDGVYMNSGITYKATVLIVEGKQIPYMMHRNQVGTVVNSNTRVLNELAKPYNATVTTHSTKTTINYWDVVYGLMSDIDGVTYVRFKDNSDPNDKTIYASPEYGSTIEIADKSYITIKDLQLQGADSVVRIKGAGSHHNIIEDCFIQHGIRRIDMRFGPYENTIRNNKITGGYLAAYAGGWGGGSGQKYAIQEQLYRLWKHVYQANNTNSFGIDLWNAGNRNEIYGNDIYNGMDAIAPYDRDANTPQTGTKIYNNIIRDQSSTGIFEEGVMDLYVHDNLFMNNNKNIRQISMSRPYPRRVFIYNNRFKNDPGIGDHNYFHWDLPEDNPPSQVARQEYYFYHNTYDGGAAAFSVNDRVEDFRGTPHMYAFNNVLSTDHFTGSSAWRGWVQNADWMGAFQYNWVGGEYVNGTPAWFRDVGNIPAEGQSIEFHDFQLPANHDARESGVDLSNMRTEDGQPLPGMTPGYFSGNLPNMGVLEF